MYTLIDIANRRIIGTTVNEVQHLHPYIIGQLDKIVNVGMLFCLHLIGNLENMSGDWYAIPTG